MKTKTKKCDFVNYRNFFDVLKERKDFFLTTGIFSFVAKAVEVVVMSFKICPISLL